jgi:hypothetical protein
MSNKYSLGHVFLTPDEPILQFKHCKRAGMGNTQTITDAGVTVAVALRKNKFVTLDANMDRTSSEYKLPMKSVSYIVPVTPYRIVFVGTTESGKHLIYTFNKNTLFHVDAQVEDIITIEPVNNETIIVFNKTSINIINVLNSIPVMNIPHSNYCSALSLRNGKYATHCLSRNEFDVWNIGSNITRSHFDEHCPENAIMIHLFDTMICTTIYHENNTLALIDLSSTYLKLIPCRNDITGISILGHYVIASVSTTFPCVVHVIDVWNLSNRPLVMNMEGVFTIENISGTSVLFCLHKNELVCKSVISGKVVKKIPFHDKILRVTWINECRTYITGHKKCYMLSSDLEIREAPFLYAVVPLTHRTIEPKKSKPTGIRYTKSFYDLDFSQ